MNEQIVLNLDRVLILLRRGLLVALALAAGAAALVYAYTRRLPPSYSAQAVVTISPTGFDSGRYGLPSVTVPPLHVIAYRIATLSNAVLGATLRGLEQADTPSAIQRLRERTAINTDDRAQVVYIVVTEHTAEGAAATANQLAAQLVAWDQGRTKAALDELTAVLEQRAATTSQQLDALGGQAASTQQAALQTVAAQTEDDLEAVQKLALRAPGSASLLQSAAAPLTTVAPTPLFNAALAALLVFALVYAALFLREMFDPRVYGAEDALRTTRLPLLALFPPTKRARGYAVELGAMLLDGLNVAAGGKQFTAVQVSSVGADEGALAVAAALAEAFTYAGQRTLLVDADMADPRLQLLYKESAQRATDLSDYLKHPEQRYRANPVGIGHSQPLYVLYERAPRPQGAAGLGRAFAPQLSSWREEFDAVVIRTAPWSASQDAALAAPLVDGTVLVTNAQRQRKRLLLGELAALRRVGGAVVGLVITQAKTDDPAAMALASSDGPLGAQAAVSASHAPSA